MNRMIGPFAHDYPPPLVAPTLTGAYNTAYTLWASPLPFGTFLPAVAMSYMLETVAEILPGALSHIYYGKQTINLKL